MEDEYVLRRSDVECPFFYKGMFEDVCDPHDAFVFPFDLAMTRARQLREFGGSYRIISLEEALYGGEV